MQFRNRQIVDVDLPALTLELLQLVGRKAADDVAAAPRDDRDEVRSGEQRPQIVVARHRALVRLHVVEGLPEDAQQILQETDVG